VLWLTLVVLSASLTTVAIRSGAGLDVDPRTSPFMPTCALGALRATFALFIFAVDAYAVLDKEIILHMGYLPASTVVKDGGPTTFQLGGWRRLSPFTMQTWTLLGVYFSVAAAASLTPRAAQHEASPLDEAVVVLFNVVFPVTVLVSTVTTWVLIPAALKAGSALPFSMATALIAHNANIFMVAVELVVSRQQVLIHLAFASVFWGLIFVAFSWAWFSRFRMFYYFFIDTTLPIRVSLLLHLGLVAAVLLFSVLGAAISALNQGRPVEQRLLIAAALCFVTMRLRVYRGGSVAPLV